MRGDPKVFVWVQHLLGIGHLKRVATLARGFRRAGSGVAIASGGTPVPGLDIADARLIQLPPLSSSLGAAHSRMTRSNAASTVTRNRSCRITLRSEAEQWNRSSGMIARSRGSTQNTSWSSRASAIGKIPLR